MSRGCHAASFFRGGGPGKRENSDTDTRGRKGLDGHAGEAIDLASIACERGMG